MTKKEIIARCKSRKGGQKTSYQLGKEGEEAAGIKKNTRIIKINGHNRIPDQLDIEERIIGEVKNVKYQGYTSQLREYICRLTVKTDSKDGYNGQLWTQ